MLSSVSWRNSKRGILEDAEECDADVEITSENGNETKANVGSGKC